MCQKIKGILVYYKKVNYKSFAFDAPLHRNLKNEKTNPSYIFD